MRISFFIFLKEIIINEIQFLIQVWWENHIEIINYIKLIVYWLEHINRDICTLCIDIVNILLIISFINKNKILINLLLPHLSLFDYSLWVDITNLFHTNEYKYLVELLRRCIVVSGNGSVEHSIIKFFENEYGFDHQSLVTVVTILLQHTSDEDNFLISFTNFLISTK